MLSVLNNRRYFYKKNMRDYCLKSTNESIQRILDREKNKNDIVKIIEEVEKSNLNSKKQMFTHVNAGTILGFLSITSFIYVFLNKK
jgi:hypothetical protein